MTTSVQKGSLHFKSSSASPETCNSFDYFTGIMAKINDFFNKGKFCDVTLIAKDSDFKVHAHKMVLCAASDYFLAMFGGSMREANEDEVTFQIDGPSLKSVINYIYTASIELTIDTVEEILITASMFELVPLKKICCEFIAKKLEPSNCLGIALFAEQYSLEELFKTSKTFVCDNYANLCKDEEFFNLDVYQLCKLLSCSELRVDSEEDVFRSLMSWINHDKPKRTEYMSPLMYHVRFPLLKPKFIASAIEPACKTIECERLICKAYKWHLLPEFRLSLFTEKQTELRNFNGLVMAISGWNDNGGTLNFGLYYPILKDWIYKHGIPGLTIGREHFGSTTLKGKLIIAGGILTENNELTDRVDCLNLKTFEWTSLAPLLTKRKLCKMANLGGCIYVVGGSNGMVNFNTVEKYDPSTKQWTYTAAMCASSDTFHVSATLNKLCVSIKKGHNLGSKYFHNLYDPETDNWTNSWLITTDALLGTGTVSVFNNDFFIALSRNSITRYNYVIKSSETISIPTIKPECIECAGFGDRMIAFGNNEFQTYNPFSNEFKKMPSFDNSRGRVILISNR